MRLGRVIGVWALVAGLLVWNGALGIGIFNPLLGREAGEMMSLFIALIIIFGASRPLLIIEPEFTRGQAVRVGLIWLGLTLAFELGFGWIGQFAGPLAPSYGMWDGSFWSIIALAMFTAPVTYLRRVHMPIPRVIK